MLEWTDDHRTGLPEFDKPNSEFHEKLNEFLRANVDGRGREHVEELLQFLESYASRHIDTQEKFLQKHGLENEQDHRKEHDHFQSELQRFRSIFDSEGVTSTMVLELQNIMGEWFVNHIGVKDLELARKVGGGALR